MEQLKQIQEALQNALMQRSGLHDQMASNKEQVAQLQNILKGVELGRQIAAQEQADPVEDLPE